MTNENGRQDEADSDQHRAQQHHSTESIGNPRPFFDLVQVIQPHSCCYHCQEISHCTDYAHDQPHNQHVSPSEFVDCSKANATSKKADQSC